MLTPVVDRDTLRGRDQQTEMARSATELYKLLFDSTSSDSLEALADKCSDDLCNEITSGRFGDVKLLLADADASLNIGPIAAYFERMRRSRSAWGEFQSVSVAPKQKAFLDGFTQLELHGTYFDWLRQRQLVHVDTMWINGDDGELHRVFLDHADGKPAAPQVPKQVPRCSEEGTYHDYQRHHRLACLRR